MTDIVTYYKAVRVDGTDFATGTTHPTVGEWMPRIEGELVLCWRGYHVSDAVAETLLGGSWPCRLFEVEIEDGEWQREHHKLVVPTYRPIKELPAWQALGPNGEAVAALIERCKTLTEGQTERLAAAGGAAWAAALALVVRDLITPEQFDVLYGPWASVMEARND